MNLLENIQKRIKLVTCKQITNALNDAIPVLFIKDLMVSYAK